MRTLGFHFAAVTAAVTTTMAASMFASPAWAAHAYSLWGDVKYPAGFTHFDYVNPNAPKGGELVAVSNLRVSTFDKYNPFTSKGTSPAYLSEMLFDSLLTGSNDELGTAYGLLAEDIDVPPDGLSATFKLRSNARFHDGKPVQAADVKYTFDTLNSKYVSPGYRTVLEDVERVEVLSLLTVRFVFKRKNRELPLTVGGLPIFSREWGKGKKFDEVVTDVPIGSGRYKIGDVKYGKDITYVRDPSYWGDKLNVNVGSGNFNRITIKIYKDNVARLEGLKAGEYDFMQFYSAADWARRAKGKRFDSGDLVKGEFQHSLPTGFQSYIFNTRRELFKDIRVRQAIGLAHDFNWMSRQLFYGQYKPVNGLFGNTECESKGSPSPEELALLEPWRSQIPPAVFGPVARQPNADGQDQLRENLRRAQALLKDAGWTVQDGVLRNAQGWPMVIEYVDSAESRASTLSAWQRNLAKLGIELKLRATDFSLYQQRLQKFDYDMASLAFQGTNNPGAEYADLFGSKAADVEDSGNYSGIKNKTVDALIERMVTAQNKTDFFASCRALERVISQSHIMVPQWYSGKHNVAYNPRKLVKPAITPPYYRADTWLMGYWWAASAEASVKK
jgi:microcin C transport system substrate-binding protein